MRDKLVELLTVTLTNGNDKTIILCKAAEAIAEYLIANGVTIPVRCKDCIYWKKRTVNEKGFIICSASGMEIHTEDFCSYGERKDDE